MKTTLDLGRSGSLVTAILRGERESWTPLVQELCPALLGFARSSRSLGHRRGEDDCSEIMTQVLERLRKNDFRALRTFEAWKSEATNAGRTLEDWLRIVTDRVACDYVTRCARRAVLNTLGVALDSGVSPDGSKLGMTDVQATRELMEHAERALPPEQSAVLRRVLDGRSVETIAREQGLEKADVERRLRAAHARLRRWVDDGGDGDASAS